MAAKKHVKKLVARSALGCFLNWSQSLSSKSNEAGLVDCTWLALRFRVQIQFMCNVGYMLAISKQQVSPFLIFGRLSWHLASWINMACALDEFYTSRALVNFRALLPRLAKICSFKPLKARLFLLCKDCQGILLIDFAKWEISWKLNNFSCLWAVGEALLAYNDWMSSGGYILDP